MRTKRRWRWVNDKSLQGDWPSIRLDKGVEFLGAVDLDVGDIGSRPSQLYISE